MATICMHTLSLCRLRVAKLEPNGVPSPGPGNQYTSDQQITMTVGIDLETGDDFVQKNGCGDIIYAFKVRDQIKSLNLQLTLGTAEPELTQLLTGGDLITVGLNTVGYAMPEVGSVGNVDGCSVEAWCKNIDGSTLDADYPYVRFVFPKTFWTLADKTLENGPINHAFTGKGEENDNWLDGPANDWPYTSDRLYQYAGDIALPTASCGSQTLPIS